MFDSSPLINQTADRLDFTFLEYFSLDFFGPESEDRGTYRFCPACHSVILSETLTLLITFEQ